MKILDYDIYDTWYDVIKGNTTIRTYRNPVKQYVIKHISKSLEEIIAENNLFDYIFDGDGSALTKYSALSNFCIFINKQYLNNNGYIFPISRNDAKEFDSENNLTSKRKKFATVYLDKSEELMKLFDDSYYTHLNNEIAIITLKALFSVALSAGFGTKELIENKDNTSFLRANDVNIYNDNQIEIRIHDNEYIDKIILPIDNSKYIIDYIKIGNSHVSKNSDSSAFFVKKWSGYELEIDHNFWNGRKPSDIVNLAGYMLIYISNKMNIYSLSLNDLRANKVYHELLISKGSALNEIIKMHGYADFVKQAYYKYISINNDGLYVGFDFFNLTSLSEKSEQIDNKSFDNEVPSDTYLTLEEKKKRNRSIVVELKQLYQNKCQICNQTIHVDGKVYYSEVHHLQPLGNGHNGTDNLHNMIVLCPNHHKMFDLGILAINPMDGSHLIHIDNRDSLNEKFIEFKHIVSNTYIRYHYENIHKKLIQELKGC